MPAENLKYYVFRRALQTLLVIFAVLILNFLIIHLAPGDPALVMAGEYASPEIIEFVRKHWGLDRPLHEQLGVYLWNLLHGDLGYSYRYLTPVAQLIAERLPVTLLLTVTSITLAFLIGTLLGVLCGRRVGSRLDIALSSTMLFLYSIPTFWLGIILMLIFAVQLKLFPTSGLMSVTAEYHGLMRILDILHHAVLPVLTLTLVLAPVYFRITKSSVYEQSAEDYVKTFRAVGMPENLVFRKYVLRNALLPPVTILGIHIGYAFAGAALVEIVFGWPGIGRLLLDAAFTRDYPVLMGIYLMIAISVTLANFIVDILYLVLDPRIRYR